MKTLSLTLIFASCCVFHLSSLGQSNWWSNEQESASMQPGSVHIIKDNRIDRLVEFKGSTIPPAFGPMINGFRVQLYFDQDKEKVNDARTRFLTSNRGIDTYVEYYAPNYNLLIGNFRTRLEAEKWRAELSGAFPEGIVKETRIYLPKLED
jgi:hypothetical protein